MKRTTTTPAEPDIAFMPSLRFPEFRNIVGWKKRTLSHLLSEPKKRNRDLRFSAGDVLSVSGEFGVVNQIALLGRSYAGASVENYHVVETNDVVYTKSPLKRNPYGIIKANKGKAGIVSTLYAVYRPTPQAHADYLDHYFSIDYNLNSYLQPIVKKGAKNDMKVNNSDVLTGEICVPEVEEQKKIAECLSTLDELIGAESQKLDALKAHKKGLMQQLFPREGETLPRLRFPEFQDAPEWNVRTIGELFRLINGCAFKPEDWKPSGTPIIRIQNLNDPFAEFNYAQAPVPEANRVEPGDLLFAWSGTLGSSFGARIWNGPSGVLNQHIFKVLMDEQEITSRFALLILARVEEDIARRTHGFKASFVHVKKSDLVEVELPLPGLPEQYRIASCLSSLDDLIAAQSDRLEALKTHKKGLMQQLFPSSEAVDA